MVDMLAGAPARCTFTVSFLVGRFGSPTKIDYRKQNGYPYSNLSNLEDLGDVKEHVGDVKEHATCNEHNSKCPKGSFLVWLICYELHRENGRRCSVSGLPSAIFAGFPVQSKALER